MALTQREAFARLMEHMCEHDGNSGHGYSQPNREGVGTELVNLGDGVKVYIKGGDRDCSSAICSCLKALGIDVHGASYTGNMTNIAKNPLFKLYKRPTSYSAKRGDIYLASGKHTAMCTHGYYEQGGDSLCQFSISEKGTVNGQTGDQTGRESNFKPFYNYPWTHTIAWASDGEVISGVLNFIGASTAGATETVIAEDDLGDTRFWGRRFTTQIQKQRGTTADGIVSGQATEDKPALPNCDTSSWRFSKGGKAGGSAMVKSIQKLTGATADGYMGKKSVKKLQEWLIKKGYGVGSSGADGSLGPATCQAVGRAIKDGAFRG